MTSKRNNEVDHWAGGQKRCPPSTPRCRPNRCQMGGMQSTMGTAPRNTCFMWTPSRRHRTAAFGAVCEVKAFLLGTMGTLMG